MTTPLSMSDLQRAYFSGDTNLPANASPVSASSGSVANAIATATLAAAAGKTNYLKGFVVTGGGATAATTVVVTVTGVAGGTMSFVLPIPAGPNVSVGIINVPFSMPIPATGANVAIAVNVPAAGAGNTNMAVVAYGYQK